MEVRREMAQHTARMKVKPEFEHAVPPAADGETEPGDEVLMWR